LKKIARLDFQYTFPRHLLSHSIFFSHKILINAVDRHPYHIILVEEIKETDYPKRQNCSRFVREQIILDQIFLENVFFSDEATIGL
jgi:hypothetical protein